MTTPDFEALKRGWNDAVADMPFDNAMSLGPHTMAYEMGRQLVAELRAAARNGELSIRRWADSKPEGFDLALRLYARTPPELSVAQQIEQQMLHRAPMEDRAEPSVIAAARKRRRAARLRW